MTQPYATDERRNFEHRDGELVGDDDPTFEDPRVARERAQERERADERMGAREQAERAHDEPLAEPRQDFGTSYLGDGAADESWQQWRQIQAGFVDDPRSAVSQAHGLVGELLDNIVRQLESERNQLEQRWTSGESVSTEDLRRCLQTYRDFFGRLLVSRDVRARA